MCSQLDHLGNRRLKDVLLGAAKSAVSSKGAPYAVKYEHWRQKEHMYPAKERRNAARSIAAVMFALWKSGAGFDARLVTS